VSSACGLTVDNAPPRSDFGLRSLTIPNKLVKSAFSDGLNTRSPLWISEKMSFGSNVEPVVPNVPCSRVAPPGRGGSGSACHGGRIGGGAG
jgi:hypothetical protein